MPPLHFQVDVSENGMRPIRLRNVEVERTREPGVGVAYRITGLITDDQLIHSNQYDRALGLPRDFVQRDFIHIAQTGGRSPMAVIGWDEATNMSEEDLAAIHGGFLDRFDPEDTAGISPPEKIETYKIIREKLDEVLTRDDTVIMED